MSSDPRAFGQSEGLPWDLRMARDEAHRALYELAEREREAKNYDRAREAVEAMRKVAA